jgi:4-amino-4-deoxy-L-arabinose transferase-like glycosyltransferase
VSAGWWVAVVELVPDSWRPYIGGSQTNSVWELIWGYNGLGRLTGNETGSVGGGTGRGWGVIGIGRLFNAQIGGQVAWLLPAALALGVAGLIAVGRAPRTDLRRAALLLWGGWLVVTGAVFSLMAGIFHAYYTVALAPAIAALVGIGGGLLWQRRERAWARTTLAATLFVTASWSFVLLGRSAYFLPWLKWLLLVVGLVVAAGLLIADQVGRTVAATLLAAGLLAGLGGPAAYALETAGSAHSGSIPSAGPAATGLGFGAAGRRGLPPLSMTNRGLPNSIGGFPGGVLPRLPAGRTGTGGTGGLLSAAVVSKELAATLAQDASSYTWVAASVGSNRAAGYQLATELPVMPLGGFNGSDPSPTLEQFQQYVADGQVHWFIGGGAGMRSITGSNSAHQIAAWVEENFAAQTIDGVAVFDLTQPVG